MPTPRGGLHRHHIVPRHAGGTDERVNLTPPISIRLHAFFHVDRWRHLGDVNDLLAYQFLRGQISGVEARMSALRERLRGRTFSPETLAKMSAAQKKRAADGRMPPITPERRAKQSAYRKGRRDLVAPMHAQTAAANRARVWTTEIRVKSSASHRRHWASLTAEEREHRTAGIRKPLDAVVRAKITAALRGLKRSAETRARVSIAAKNRAKKTVCKHGHPFDSLNTHFYADGSRRCRTCDRLRHRKALGAA
jgi:hypothetical protein